MPTRSSQEEDADERNVIEPRNRVFALRAPGAGTDNRLLARHPVDADIQETPDATADGKPEEPHGPLRYSNTKCADDNPLLWTLTFHVQRSTVLSSALRIALRGG